MSEAAHQETDGALVSMRNFTLNLEWWKFPQVAAGNKRQTLRVLFSCEHFTVKTMQTK
jgi:hypothetical protein